MPPKKKKNKSKAKTSGSSSEKRSTVSNIVVSYHDCGYSTDDYDSDDSHSDRKYNEFKRPMFRGKGVENLAKMANKYGMFQEAIADLQTAICGNGGVIPEGKEAEFKEMCMNQYEEVAIPNDGPDSECVFFSGKTDATKFNVVVEVTASGTKTTEETTINIQQHHICLAGETGGRFLGHVIPGDEKDPQKVADKIWEFLKEHRYHNELMIIGGDPEQINTDPERGVFHRIQAKKGHRLTVVVRMLQSLKNMLNTFIVPRIRSFSPDMVRCLTDCLRYPVSKRPYNPDFEPIPAYSVYNDEYIPVFFPEECKDREGTYTDDEDYITMIWPVITQKHYHVHRDSDTSFKDFLKSNAGKGVSPDKDLARANGFLRMYISKYSLSSTDTCNLKDIVHFIIYFFYPTWFRVRSDKAKLVDAPTFVLEMVKSIRYHVPKKLQAEVKTVVESESWMAHPEIMLLHMLVSEDAEKRQLGVDKILRLRGANEFGDTAVRPFLPSRLNWEAESVQDLIDWESTVITEPIQTATLSRKEIREFLESPLNMRPFTCHGRRLNRIKYQMSRASEEVTGSLARDNFVHHRCDLKILMARILDDPTSDESDPENEDDAQGASGFQRLSLN